MKAVLSGKKLPAVKINQSVHACSYIVVRQMLLYMYIFYFNIMLL